MGGNNRFSLARNEISDEIGEESREERVVDRSSWGSGINDYTIRLEMNPDEHFFSLISVLHFYVCWIRHNKIGKFDKESPWLTTVEEVEWDSCNDEEDMLDCGRLLHEEWSMDQGEGIAWIRENNHSFTLSKLIHDKHDMFSHTIIYNVRFLLSINTSKYIDNITKMETNQPEWWVAVSVHLLAC